jgi:putative transcriptional regulator
MKDEVDIAKGKVLIAEPFSNDIHFRRSVVLLCEHSPEAGTIGFVLNKKTSLNLQELVEDFPEFEGPVYYGGPVATSTLHYVHNVGDILEESIEVCKGIYWGGDFEKLKFLIKSKLVTPINIRFYIGYSGWSEGQLRNELEHGSWVIEDAFANYIFKTNPKNLWRQVLNNRGDTYSVIAQMPDAPSMN